MLPSLSSHFSYKLFSSQPSSDERKYAKMKEKLFLSFSQTDINYNRYILTDPRRVLLMDIAYWMHRMREHIARMEYITHRMCQLCELADCAWQIEGPAHSEHIRDDPRSRTVLQISCLIIFPGFYLRLHMYHVILFYYKQVALFCILL